MPLPPSPLSIAGGRTTTPFTRIPGWATAHPANTSCCLNPPPVRFNGVNSNQGKVWLTYNSAEYLQNYIYPRHGVPPNPDASKTASAVLVDFAQQATE